ncbi:hypothetical protein AB0J35_09715 [Nonomuraea angiospora]|uniref:hypothetical protein n=1 Tax=Nonomuraea angiospora TaxID=46172 RepID=UPI0034287DB0
MNDDLAPLAVSDDGRRVAYFRKHDGRLVVRELGGGVHTIADEVPARGYGMGEVRSLRGKEDQHQRPVHRRAGAPVL